MPLGPSLSPAPVRRRMVLPHWARQLTLYSRRSRRQGIWQLSSSNLYHLYINPQPILLLPTPSSFSSTFSRSRCRRDEEGYCNSDWDGESSTAETVPAAAAASEVLFSLHLLFPISRLARACVRSESSASSMTSTWYRSSGS